MGEWWRLGVEVVAWGAALVWCWRTSDLVRLLPTVADLTGEEWDVKGSALPSLTVVVPARNEEAKIAATLDALLLADLPGLKVIAVDDRSEDRTGVIMDAYAVEYGAEGRSKPQGLKPRSSVDALRPKAEALGYLEAGGAEALGQLEAAGTGDVMRPRTEALGYSSVAGAVRLEVLHVRALPAGWLGKTHAMAQAFERCTTEFVLFTDADVLFSPSVLRRAVIFAQHERADHLVVMPTMQIESWGEGVVLGFFKLMAMWGLRLWKVADPAAKRDAIGVGAFNLVRRAALEAIGGWEPERMQIVEDLVLGRRMKAAGMRQRVAFAPGMVLVHWALGVRGIVNVMTKNLFAAFNYRAVLLLLTSVGLFAFAWMPLYGLFFRVSVLPCVLLICCVAASYRALGRAGSKSARYGWLYPLGAVIFAWALLRSMAMTLWNGGVEWRGTLYPLRELREHNRPFRQERATVEE